MSMVSLQHYRHIPAAGHQLAPVLKDREKSPQTPTFAENPRHLGF